jgi:NOL1/NOP2/fmu family ribosome biogenesis protein
MLVINHMDNQKISIVAMCDLCKESTNLELKTNEFKEWIAGVDIDKAFPKLTKEEKDLLTEQCCQKCYKEFTSYH